MVDHSSDIIRDQNVHGWLMDVPGYSDYSNSTIISPLNDSTLSHNKKGRPLSSLSTSSEYSVDLDDLISANFTTDMIDETDLPDLASLELDDSNEDFWKVKQVLNHYIPSGKTEPSYYHNSNRSTFETNDLFVSNNTPNETLTDHYFDSKKNATYLGSVDASNEDYKNGYHTYSRPTPAGTRLQVPKSSLPLSRRTSASSDLNLSDRNRSSSFGSDHSLNSQVTITHGPFNRNIYPSESTSTSSIGSHSTAASSLIPRSFTTSSVTSIETSSSRISQSCLRQQGMSSSISENSNNSIDTSPSRLPGRSISGLAKRATHIPVPYSSNLSSKPSSLHHTKSTSLFNTQPKQNMTRSLSRMGQPIKRASHIPVPPRSTTSLGISSVFSTQSSSLHKNDESKSKLPSIRSSTPNGSIRTNSRMGDHDTKSSGLKMPRAISKIGTIKRS
ncbi:hypothetical protein BDB01DRAFT_16848 [Pilobolus umbonatus]|nr:hypothetical protein BDB01DRAFT_16848 [Pilobolus umbonatus]